MQQMPFFDSKRGFFSVEYNSNDDGESITVTEVVKDILKNEANPFILPKPEDSICYIVTKRL